MDQASGRETKVPFGELPPNTLLRPDEVADWLKVARRQVQRLEIPWIDLGRRFAAEAANGCGWVARHAIFGDVLPAAQQ